MLLRELFEAPGKQASFALGRLNPATTGHELLVDKIKEEPGDSFLFLTDRLPKLPKDPLTAQDKLDWARKSFDGISIGLAKTVLIAADRLYKMGYTDVTYLEGIDPEKPFPLSKLLKDYNGVKKELHDYNFNSIRVVQLPRDASSEAADGMSGTKMRQLVADNNLEKFKQDAVTLKAQPYAEEMFKKLQGIMGVDSVDEKLDLKDLEDDPDYQKELEKEFLKTLSPSQRKRYGKKMFDNIQENTENVLPDKIKPMKPYDPPKAPDATIPLNSKKWHTEPNGTRYKKDKYDDNLVHVSNSGGKFTFDGSRLIKWQTPKISGLQHSYDYVQKKITVTYKSDVFVPEPGSKGQMKVGTGTGDTDISLKAIYDFKGNKIKDSGSTEVGAGSFKAKVDKSGATLSTGMFDPFNKVKMIVKSNPEKVKKYGKGKLKAILDKDLGLLKQSSMGRAVPGTDYEKVTQRLMQIADVSFRDASGKSIPARQAMAGAKEWWASLNRTNKDKNAQIAKMRAPQKPANTEQ